ncbi:MAG: xanthine dehydrogenase family protein molybdopterin-binding subunit, partial [Streptosporangiales bacterium]|nr:xanthine dehydrogenase family protein molybdopterin-binding subunit [Streptosporangiales bacterium]
MSVVEEHRPEVGNARLRKEDAHLVTGQTNWTDNITPPGTLHIAILRSPMAHARITDIDLGPARDRPGVVAVFSGRDVADEQGTLPCAWPVTEDMVHPDHPALAVDEVRFAGEAVAVVVARDTASAVDALEAIEVDYDPLPVVLDMEAAVADGSPLVHADKGTNSSFTWVFDSAEAGTGGSVDEALGDAEVTVSRRFLQQRLIPSFMEPRSVVVDPTGGQFTMWSATQIPHILRLMLALTTNTPEHKLRVVAPDVGGGFGGKLQVTPEEVITLVAAKRLHKPVKYTETRSDSLLTAHHGRDQIQQLDLAARRDGTITGLKVRLLANMGAYLGLVTPGVPLLGAFMFNAIYKMPAYRFECTGVFTNTAWTDAYRGAGRPEATFAIERMMDELAAELGMDPMEVRRRNWIAHEEFPFTTVAGLTYDSGNYEAATDKAMELFGYDALRREQAERRERGDPVQLGLGISTYT